MQQKLTHFGYTSVPESEKVEHVGAVFSSVANKYDIMNDFMSLGSHRIWKQVLIEWIHPRPYQKILDIAGGTGDMSRILLNRTQGTADVTLCDINPDMIEAGSDKHPKYGAFQRVCGDAESLPFPDNGFDVAINSFGLRNVTRIDTALSEARRILRPMGRFFILEFSAVQIPVFEKLYEHYSFSVLPELGQWVAGDRKAYQYLAESIRKFPAQQEMSARMSNAGFRTVKLRELFGGIATIYCGWA